ncbi:hypothetical protein ACSNN9_18525 [Micromonospora sp. URMC 107]|uniref:hypothetical protein n=1 Tax=Micromonospora sp. URMC 107 TaxID=3423418 RepID=UPI003F1AFB22
MAQRLCARHVDEAAAAAIATGIDWTDDAAQILADTRVIPLRPSDAPWAWCGYDDSCRREAYPRPDSVLHGPTSRERRAGGPTAYQARGRPPPHPVHNEPEEHPHRA